MPTSTWLNIEFCVEKFWKIFGKGAKTFLDIGPGFGRWGLLAREMGDIIRGRTHPNQWQCKIEAIEIFEPYIRLYNLDRLYSKIHIGDVCEILPLITQEKGDKFADIVFYGDVLEHLEKEEALDIIDFTFDHVAARAIFINIPLGGNWKQGQVGSNPYEAHKSIWTIEDFQSKKEGWTIEKKLFQDFKHRDYLTYLATR